ncbi:Arm DNA-binding domain-containing protein [Dyadobacter frigoris]|uniref:Arm DNA-binding domain-containing protein n=1 Tax=Dyadobacter frigoris TaxID=2576211 RepID=UPI001E33C286|nr:Arm DNA-binding domain-containing protein [Dyadobacter frigoris]GLU57164.1 hypothetical protein Dfri01_66250 [Dyadobacter frigoris]
MTANLSLLFYVRKQKNYDGGEAPIYLRLTVNGKRIEIATGRQCDPKRWNTVKPVGYLAVKKTFGPQMHT